MNTAGPDTTNTAILVVDDEESLRETFQFFLQNQGYSPVITASNFEEAVAAAKKYCFDLIISDIVLGGRSGIDFLKQLREMAVACPVIMVTGYPNVDTAAEAVRLGAFDYLPKPVEKEPLLKTARLALQQHQLEREKKRAEQEREHYRSFLQTVFNSVADCIVTVAPSLKILQMNPAAKVLFHELHPGIGEQDSFTDLCSREELAPLKKDLLDTLKSGSEISRHRIECKSVDHRSKVLSVCISPLQGGDGTLEGAVIVLRDMSNPVAQLQGRKQFFHRFIGQSEAMQSVYTMIENVGRVDFSILITGESGTGKELAAEAIHLESRRTHKPLVKVDCTAIPENLLESELFGHKKGSFTGADRDRMGRILQADGGSLFLDEIGDISPTMQLRLLRFLQESTFYPVGRDNPIQVDVRVIAATNVDLKEKVRQGDFREDLYFRLRVIDIMLPPLRERENDIFLLTNHFIGKIAAQIGKAVNGVSDQAMALLTRYYWPGNVRELEHVLERACVLCTGPTIATEQLPQEIQQWSPRKMPTKEERVIDTSPPTCILPPSPEPMLHQGMEQRILVALQKSGGNKAKAARILNIDRTTLYRKLKELNIDLSSLDL